MFANFSLGLACLQSMSSNSIPFLNEIKLYINMLTKRRGGADVWVKLRGLVKSRQLFITDNSYFRGLSGPSCIVLTPIKSNSHQSIFQFMVNTNIRGWIPQYVIDKSMSSVLCEYVTCLNRYSSRLQEEKVLPLIKPK